MCKNKSYLFQKYKLTVLTFFIEKWYNKSGMNKKVSDKNDDSKTKKTIRK